MKKKANNKTSRTPIKKRSGIRPKVSEVDRRKAFFLAELQNQVGVITATCLSTKIGRSTVYEWMESDAEFKAQVLAIQETQIDFAESQLFRGMQNGNPACIIFFLKNKARKRGYSKDSEAPAMDTEQGKAALPQTMIERFHTKKPTDDAGSTGT